MERAAGDAVPAGSPRSGAPLGLAETLRQLATDEREGDDEQAPKDGEGGRAERHALDAGRCGKSEKYIQTKCDAWLLLKVCHVSQ